MSRRAQYWGYCLAGLVFAQMAASFLLAERGRALTATSDVIQCALLLCATLSCIPGLLRGVGRVRLFWALMGFGLSNWLVYQILWTYIEVVQRRDVPSLFAGDAIVFLHFVPMIAALALQPNIQQDERELRLGSLDFALLLFWWVYLYVYTVMPWQYVQPNEVAYSHNLNSSYLLEKIAFLVGLAVVWYRSSGLWRSIYAHWFGASLLYSSSSYVANWALNGNWYYSGSFYDLPMVVSMAWMAVPGLLALQSSPQQPVSEKSLPRGVWAARLGMLAVFSLPIFACLQAVGPWEYYGFPPAFDSLSQKDEMLATLKTQQLFVIDVTNRDGLITFPSFHVVLTALAAAALWPLRWVRQKPTTQALVKIALAHAWPSPGHFVKFPARNQFDVTKRTQSCAGRRFGQRQEPRRDWRWRCWHIPHANSPARRPTDNSPARRVEARNGAKAEPFRQRAAGVCIPQT